MAILPAVDCIDGRYRVIRPLGQGGMGRVFLVADLRRSERRLALKTLRPEAIPAGGEDWFAHEFLTLASLHHPNVAEIYDFGSEASTGERYFTSEFVDGHDLYAACATASQGEILDLVVQLCRGLEYVHSRGLVHHDVKPANVLVTGAGQVKLIDFGLATRPSSTLGRRVRGTVQYMAPEKFRGDPVDRRADLYSLGVTLYEVLTRRHPFGGGSSMDVVRSHLDAEPPPLGPGTDGLPARLGPVVLRLLAKVPAERQGSAAEVVREINRRTGTRYEVETVATREGYILSGRLVGRRREWERVEGLLAGLQAGRPANPLVLISGEAGIGKRRLVRELRQRAQTSGLRVVEATCGPDGASFAPWARVLEELEALHREEPEVAAALAAHGPVLAEAVPALARWGSEAAAHDAEAAGAGEVERHRRVEAAVGVLSAVAARHPLVVVLHDLAWADEGTLALVCRLAAGAATPEGAGLDRAVSPFPDRLLTVVTLDDSEVAGRPAETVASLLRGLDSVARLEPGRLGVAEVEELAASMLPLDGGHELAPRLHAASGGNPLFIEETMKSLVEEGTLVCEEGRWHERAGLRSALATPASVKDLMERRLRSLSGPERAVLASLAAWGDRSTAADVAATSAVVSGEAYPALTSLERRGLAFRSEDGGLRLSHPAVREAALAALPEVARTGLHRAIVRRILDGPGAAERVEEVAYHALRGGEPAAASGHALEAARRARRLHELARARSFYRACLDGAPSPTTREEALAELGDVEEVSGHLDAAVRLWGEALGAGAGAPDPSRAAALHRRLGDAHARRGRFAEAAREFDEARAGLGVLADGVELARLDNSQGWTFIRQGDYGRAVQVLEEARGRLEGGPHERELAKVFNALGTAYHDVGDYPKAVEYHRRGIALGERTGDLPGLAAAYNNLGLVHWDMSEYEQAVECHTRGLAISRRLGDPLGREKALHNLGNVYWDRGDYERARRHYQEGLAVARGRLDERGLALASLNLGSIAMVTGDYGAAAEFTRRAMEGAERAQDRYLAACARCNMASWALLAGDLDEALAECDRAERAVAELGARALEKAIGDTRGQALMARGEAEAALAALRGAVGVAEATGNRKGRSESLAHLAEVARSVGRREEAEPAAREALELARALGLDPVVARALAVAARIALESDHPEEAREPAEEALRLALRLGEPELVWRAHHLAARLARLRGDRPGAAEHLRAAGKEVQALAERLPEGTRRRYLKHPERQALETDVLAMARESPALPAAPRADGPAATAPLAFGATTHGELDAELGGALVRRPGAVPLRPEELERLLAINRALNATLDHEQVLEAIVDGVADLTGARRGYMILAGPETAEEDWRVVVTRNAPRGDRETTDHRVSRTIARRVLASGEPILLMDARGEGDFREAKSVADLGVLSVLCLPLRLAGRVEGVIYLDNNAERGVFTERAATIASHFAEQAGIALQNARLYRDAIRDPQTGCYGGTYFEGRLQEEVRRAARYGKDLSLLAVHIDNLAVIRARHPGATALEVVRATADDISGCVRAIDVTGRLRDDRFGVVLVETGEAGALTIARRVQSRMAARSFRTGEGSIEPTLTVGIVGSLDERDDWEAVTRRLERALEAGRLASHDRVGVYESESAAASGDDIDRLILSREGRDTLRLITSMVSTELDLDKLVDLIVSMIVEVTGAERGFLMLVDGERLVCASARGIDSQEVESPEFEVSHSIIRQVASRGEPALVRSSVDDDRFRKAQSLIDLGPKSIVCVPVLHQGRTIAVVYVDANPFLRSLGERELNLLVAFASRIAGPLRNSRVYKEQAENLQKVQRAYQESVRALEQRYAYDNIVGKGAAMQEVFRLLDRIVDSQQPIFIHGESGTGKELVAKAIHYNGPRKERPFVAENCAAMPETLLEAELFGHVKGAFTGADSDKKGLFEVADGGALFLDEVGEMSVEMQKKLLRVLQEGEIRPVGGKSIRKVDVRLITASNKDLRDLVREGAFREDLFYRMHVIRIDLPPLRDRLEDIPLLVDHFLDDVVRRDGGEKRRFSRQAMAKVLRYGWPGNIRELKNFVEKVVVLSSGEVIDDELVRFDDEGAPTGADGALLEYFDLPFASARDQFTIAYLRKALETHGGNVSHAAEASGMKRQSLHQFMRKYGIRAQEFKNGK
ncbi:MAG: sigma 54-interacting transcriptional regulator [Planctomycetes bacterium]|nr:sigma 54-interacting transcriptional regulator [Planctomycetota bacterium]